MMYNVRENSMLSKIKLKFLYRYRDNSYIIQYFGKFAMLYI